MRCFVRVKDRNQMWKCARHRYRSVVFHAGRKISNYFHLYRRKITLTPRKSQDQGVNSGYASQKLHYPMTWTNWSYYWNLPTATAFENNSRWILRWRHWSLRRKGNSYKASKHTRCNFNGWRWWSLLSRCLCHGAFFALHKWQPTTDCLQKSNQVTKRSN